jgi:hypothetical protein
MDLFTHESLIQLLYSYSHRIKGDHQPPKRSRLACNHAMYTEWEAQAPDLVSAYLQWKYNPISTLSTLTSPAPLKAPTNAELDASSEVPSTLPLHYFDMTVVDIKGAYEDCQTGIWN